MNRSARVATDAQYGVSVTDELAPPRAVLWLDEALRDVVEAPSWEERETARERFLALGTEAIPAVLTRLVRPQPPEISDLLVEFISTWTPLDSLLSAVCDRNHPVRMRIGLIEALSLLSRREPDASLAQIGSTLAGLAKSASEEELRLAAVEGIGSVGVADAEVRRILEDLAENDPQRLVREEASSVVEEIG